VHESVAGFLGTLKTPSRGIPKQAADSMASEAGGNVDDSDEVGIELMRAFGGAGGIIAADVGA
jgi:hypothetical protein